MPFGDAGYPPHHYRHRRASSYHYCHYVSSLVSSFLYRPNSRYTFVGSVDSVMGLKLLTIPYHKQAEMGEEQTDGWMHECMEIRTSAA